MSKVLITEATEQMGVSVELKGEKYWMQFLEKEVAEGRIDDVKRTEWEEKYDGYMMEWSFSNPFVTPVDGQIDAACMLGAKQDLTGDYAGGGWCCGIRYVGSFSP